MEHNFPELINKLFFRYIKENDLCCKPHLKEAILKLKRKNEKDMTSAFGAMVTWDYLPEKRAFWATHSFKLYDYLYNNKAINITEYYQLISYILRFNSPRRSGVNNKEYIKLYNSYAQLFNHKVEL